MLHPMRPFDRISSEVTLLALAALALGGCTSYTAKDIDASASARALEQRTLSDAGLGRFLAAHHLGRKGEWDLDRLTLAALYFSPDFSAARAELAGAEGDAATAGEWPNPSFAFTPAYNADAAPGQTPWILGYTLAIPVDLTGRIANHADAALRRKDAARLRLAAAAWSARASVRQALAALHAAETSAKLWSGLGPTIAAARKALASQVATGELSPAEAARVRLTLDRAELAQREAEQSRILARSRLAETIGLPLTALERVSLSFRGLSAHGRPPRAGEARLWAAQHRADVQAALADYAATQADLRSEISRQYPDVTLSPGYELDQGEGKWSLGLGFTLPLFNRNGGAIAAAEARRAAAAAKFEALQLRVMAEVDRAAAAYAAAVADLASFSRMDADISVATKLLTAQQAVGDLSPLESARLLLEQADSLMAAQAARLRAEQSLASLEAAIQRPLGLLNTDIAQPNPSKQK